MAMTEAMPSWAQSERDSFAPLAVGLVLALLVHGGLATTTALAPPKKLEERVEMTIYKPKPPPKPPEPPPPPPEEKKPPPPPPKKEPPPPPPPPPPNETPKEPPPKEDIPVVTGISMASTVQGNSGLSVRVGNTTYGDPNKEKFVDPKDVKPYQGGSPEFKAARASTITREPRVLKDYKYFPKELAAEGAEGSVIVAISISKTGTIIDVRLIKSSGNPRMDEVALDNIKHFRFAPAEVNGEAVDFVLRHTYKFELYD
jgi:protein TonB